jgi:hypothetical protein
MRDAAAAFKFPRAGPAKEVIGAGVADQLAELMPETRSSRDERRQEAHVDPDTKLHPLVGRQGWHSRPGAWFGLQRRIAPRPPRWRTLLRRCPPAELTKRPR